jgi:hypothetical protein
MVRGMGEGSFEELLPWLMQTLTSESGAVDRSGAAQGLAEVVGGLGVEKLDKLMPGEHTILVWSRTSFFHVVEIKNRIPYSNVTKESFWFFAMRSVFTPK